VPYRVHEFRQRASEADAAAQKVRDPHLKLQYRAIAIAWADLAAEASRLLSPEEKPNDSSAERATNIRKAAAGNASKGDGG
jgi:hypothetical protein